MGRTHCYFGCGPVGVAIPARPKAVKESVPGPIRNLGPGGPQENDRSSFPTDDNWDQERDVEYLPLNDEDRVNALEVHRIMRKRSTPNTAPGEDGIMASYLKKVPDIIVSKITDCFNKCLEEGRFPKEWKRAVLVLIPKGTLDISEPKVCPICLLNEMGKALERVLAQRIEDWTHTKP